MIETRRKQPVIDECHCFMMRRAARRMTQFYDDMLAPVGLRVSQFSLLALVNELGTPTINEMAELLELDRTTAGKNLRPLERSGHVVTLRSEKDGRSRVTKLTEKGRATLKEASILWREAQRMYEAVNGRDAIDGLERELAAVEIPAVGP